MQIPRLQARQRTLMCGQGGTRQRESGSEALRKLRQIAEGSCTSGETSRPDCLHEGEAARQARDSATQEGLSQVVEKKLLLCRYTLPPRILAGSNRIAFNVAKRASTVIPTIRNGIESSQTIGKRNSASSASGQHNRASMSQSKNLIMVCLHHMVRPHF